MDRFFDELSRVMATQMPRRKAFGVMWKVAVGAALAGAIAKPALAAVCYPGRSRVGCSGGTPKCCATPGGTPTTGICCASNAVCCGAPNGGCCPAGYCCKPGGGCSQSQAECNPT